MIENQKNIFINKISIKNIIKNFSLPIYVYNYKKILFFLYILIKVKFFFFYSVKSNDNLFLLKIINKIFKKFDIVSIGELKKIILISKKKPKIIFSGCGKTINELLISFNFNIFSINIESIQELLKIIYLKNTFKKNINLMIRINPNIKAYTHKNISTGMLNNKFGIPLKNIYYFFLLEKILNLNIIGYSIHIGSQIFKLKSFKKVFFFFKKILQVKKYNYIDIGGGLSSNYYNKKNINFKNYFNEIKKIILKNQINTKIISEFGRIIFCDKCYILSKVNYIKYNNNIKMSILNVGMNDIIRPSLYNSFHKFESFNNGKIFYNFYGPICESSDKFCNNKIKIKNNSIIIIYSTGSYCKVISNNYNSKEKIFEILIYNNKIKIIYKKESFYNLINNYE